MKELSIEEKAKAYDKAIKVAADIKAGTATYITDGTPVIDAIFPELKESEDERIRKRIIDILEHDKKHYLEEIAWLEKQGQKSADKAKPKFKVGDWIVTDKNHIWLIDKDCSTTGYSYRLISQNGKVEVGDYNIVDEHARLWTIQDAKDGDVLCTYECYEPKIVFVLKGTPKEHYALSYYCYYNIMYPHFDDGNNPGCLAPKNSDVKPAAKEQRDLLFQKMKEAGYEWDANNKELNKIHIIDEGKAEMDYCFTKMMNGEKVSSTWSEEDENILKDIEEAIINYWHGDTQDILLDWLKFLKQRIRG